MKTTLPCCRNFKHNIKRQGKNVLIISPRRHKQRWTVRRIYGSPVVFRRRIIQLQTATRLWSCCFTSKRQEGAGDLIKPSVGTYEGGCLFLSACRPLYLKTDYKAPLPHHAPPPVTRHRVVSNCATIKLPSLTYDSYNLVLILLRNIFKIATLRTETRSNYQNTL